MNQLDMWPRYRCEAGTYSTVQEAAVALGRVTVRGDYQPIPKPTYRETYEWQGLATALQAGAYMRPTMFVEIDAVPGEQPEWARQMWWKRPGSHDGYTLEETAEAGVEALRAALECINSDDIYLMPHSAGYDSRLISILAGERNDGNTYFVVWQPEVDAAKRLLELLGRNESRVIVAGTGDVDYQYPALHMLALGAYQSEPDRLLVGPSLADHALGTDWADRDVITATLADETLAFNIARWPSVAYFHAARLFDGPKPWASKNWIMPFVSEPWLRFLTHYKIRNADELKLAMIRQVNPAAALPDNPRFELAKEITRNGHHSYARLSDGARKRIEDDYNASWYGREVAVGFGCPEAFGSHDHSVRQYIAASICEYLICEGVTVCSD